MKLVFSATIAIFFFLSLSGLGGADKLLVLNRIGNGETLRVYCQAPIDHRDRHTIPDGENASWSIFVPPRQFLPSMCNGVWESPSRRPFTLYNYHRDHERCRDGCTLQANGRGLYVWNEEKEEWELVQNWGEEDNN